MKPIWMLTVLSALFLACGGDDDAAADDNGSAGSGGQDDAYGQNPYGGQQGGPGGGQGMGPGGPGGDPSAQGGGDPYGSGGPGGQFGNGGQPGGPPKPTFDPSLPEGKKQVWTKAKITKQWKGKPAGELIKSFGNPLQHAKQGSFVVYFFDKMYVTDKNMKYSKITVAIQPDGKGGGNVFAIGLVPNSATPLRPNGGGQGGPPQGYPGGGQGGPPGGFNQGGGGPPQGYPGGGQGGPPQGYPGGGGQGRPPQGFQPQPRN